MSPAASALDLMRESPSPLHPENGSTSSSRADLARLRQRAANERFDREARKLEGVEVIRRGDAPEDWRFCVLVSPPLMERSEPVYALQDRLRAEFPAADLRVDVVVRSGSDAESTPAPTLPCPSPRNPARVARDNRLANARFAEEVGKLEGVEVIRRGDAPEDWRFCVLVSPPLMEQSQPVYALQDRLRAEFPAADLRVDVVVRPEPACESHQQAIDALACADGLDLDD